MEYRKPTIHRMTRRAAAHDYTRPGIYPITLHVADDLGQPFGTVVGNPLASPGSPDTPRVALTPLGQMVEHELLTTIHHHYPMVTVQDYVIMPEHIHCLMAVQDVILSSNGKHQPLGQVIAGFKKGCNKRYWAMQEAAAAATANASANAATATDGGQTAAHTPPNSGAAIANNSGAATANNSGAATANNSGATVAAVSGGVPATGSVRGGLPAAYKVPSSGTSGRQPLFDSGFCDVMPVDASQLATQRAYIAGNPRSRLLRTTHRAWLMPRRASVSTALSLPALRGYLLRECPPHLATPEALADIETRLLTTTPAAERVSGGLPAEVATSAAPASAIPPSRPLILCDTYGDPSLLTRRCLPVVCHRRDARRFGEQQARCLAEAARGTVLISARIAKGEQTIMDEALRLGFPVVIIHDNGFPDRYHPSADRLDFCAAGRLLLITPWQYHYRPDAAAISVPVCKTMNCVAQALCRTRDNWWLAPNK